MCSKAETRLVKCWGFGTGYMPVQRVELGLHTGGHIETESYFEVATNALKDSAWFCYCGSPIHTHTHTQTLSLSLSRKTARTPRAPERKPPVLKFAQYDHTLTLNPTPRHQWGAPAWAEAACLAAGFGSSFQVWAWRFRVSWV